MFFRHAENSCGARGRQEQPQHRLDGSGLASPIRTDKPIDRALLDREIEVLECYEVIEGFCELICLNNLHFFANFI